MEGPATKGGGGGGQGPNSDPGVYSVPEFRGGGARSLGSRERGADKGGAFGCGTRRSLGLSWEGDQALSEGKCSLFPPCQWALCVLCAHTGPAQPGAPRRDSSGGQGTQGAGPKHSVESRPGGPGGRRRG